MSREATRAVDSADSEQMPELVRSRVAFARRGLASMRALQSLCCALSVSAVALAAGVHAGLELFDRGLWIVAVLDGLLIAVACALGFRRTSRQVARQIDGALELDGALLTAWEAEGLARPSRIARRLGIDVAARVPAPDMLRSILPNAIFYFALPFVATALLFGTLEEVRQAPIVQDLESLTRQMEKGLAALSEQGELSEAQGPESLELADQDELRRLRGAAGELGERVRDGLATPEELAQLGAEMARFEEKLRDSAEMSQELRSSMNSLDAARMAMEGQESRETASGAREGSQEGGMSGSEGRSVAPGGEDGRMARQEIPPTGPESPGDVEREEAGVLGRPSWPAAHETILRRYVEASRQSRNQR